MVFPQRSESLLASIMKTNVFLPSQLPRGDAATVTMAPDVSPARFRLGTECFVFSQEANAKRRLA